jgi:hypothetical protein
VTWGVHAGRSARLCGSRISRDRGALWIGWPKNGPEAKATEARQATQAAEAEVVQLRQVTEQAVQETEALRAGRAKAADADADRPAMVASRIDGVQFRRLQEAERARKSLGLLLQLKAAWRE